MLSTESIESLSNRFGFADRVRIEAGEGGLPRIVVTSPLAEAEIYLHGGQVTRYKPSGQQDVLFMSSKSLFQPGKAIRGGVPICFPWFGPRSNEPAAPAHGFARLESFDLESTTVDPDGTVHLSLLMHANDLSRRWWKVEFSLRYRITIGRQLSLQLEMTNMGTQPVVFEEALHTYFRVGDIHRVKVIGLEETHYLSRVEQGDEHIQPVAPITFAGETDRTYIDTTDTCLVEDASLGRRIQIEKQGSNSTVVWNPWIDKSRAMADFGDDEWPGMVCVETGNIGPNAVLLNASATHIMQAVITVL